MGKSFDLFLQTLHTSAADATYAECMNKGRYSRSRWWVAASAVGGFVAMFGALFAHDRGAFDATDGVEAAAAPVATPVTQAAPSTTTNRGVRPGATTQQSTRQVQPTAPSTTTTQPHTHTRAS